MPTPLEHWEILMKLIPILTETPTGVICLLHTMVRLLPMILLEIHFRMEPGLIHGKRDENLPKCPVAVQPGHTRMMQTECVANAPTAVVLTIILTMATS